MMKLKTKIIISGLAALLSIAYLVCSLVIPAETIEFINKVGVILNYPITIAGVSMTIGGLFSYFLVNIILKTTKFGRKELDNMKADNEAVKNEVEQFKANTLNTIKNFKTEIDDFKKDTETKTTVMINQFEVLQNNMLSALEIIPNKKVQAIIIEYKATYEAKKQEFIEKAVDADKYIENKLTDMFKQFMAKVEEKLNEKEETINIEAEAA